MTLDAGLQNPPEEIGRLVARMGEGYDYVGSIRKQRNDRLVPLQMFSMLGIMLFGIGLLGEYIGCIYQQVRHRPRYLVEAVLEKM